MKKYIVLVVLLTCLVSVNPTIAQNENTDIQSKAKQDAIADVEQSKYFAGGLSVSLIGCLGGCLVGCVTSNESTSGLLFDSPMLNKTTAIATMGVIDLIGAAVVSQNTPVVPVDNLIGKDAAYVEQYSEVYKSTVTKQRLKWSLIGSVTGFTALSVFILVNDNL